MSAPAGLPRPTPRSAARGRPGHARRSPRTGARLGSWRRPCRPSMPEASIRARRGGDHQIAEGPDQVVNRPGRDAMHLEHVRCDRTHSRLLGAYRPSACLRPSFSAHREKALGLLDDRRQGLLGSPARLQEGREVAARRERRSRPAWGRAAAVSQGGCRVCGLDSRSYDASLQGPPAWGVDIMAKAGVNSHIVSASRRRLVSGRVSPTQVPCAQQASPRGRDPSPRFGYATPTATRSRVRLGRLTGEGDARAARSTRRRGCRQFQAGPPRHAPGLGIAP